MSNRTGSLMIVVVQCKEKGILLCGSGDDDAETAQIMENWKSAENVLDIYLMEVKEHIRGVVGNRLDMMEGEYTLVV